MPYFVETSDGQIQKVDGEFIPGETEVSGDTEAVYLVGKTFRMKRALMPEGGTMKAPRKYTLADGSRKTRADMNAEELAWLNAKIAGGKKKKAE